jgi:hypothetical protein
MRVHRTKQVAAFMLGEKGIGIAFFTNTNLIDPIMSSLRNELVGAFLDACPHMSFLSSLRLFSQHLCPAT